MKLIYTPSVQCFLSYGKLAFCFYIFTCICNYLFLIRGDASNFTLSLEYWISFF